jgi:hypothetical protein
MVLNVDMGGESVVDMNDDCGVEGCSMGSKCLSVGTRSLAVGMRLAGWKEILWVEDQQKY